MVNDTFCILPWISVGMNPHGTIRACGRSKAQNNNPSLKKCTIVEAWNSDYYTGLRTDMINGIRNDVCQKCHLEEDLGGYSKRMMFNEQHEYDMENIASTTIDGQIKTLPSVIDLRVGNICNLKCIHCWTGNSSKWYEDSELLDKYPNLTGDKINNEWISNKGNVWDYIKENIDTIKTLNVLGGEPLASKEFVALLDWMIKNNHRDVEVKMVTNGTLLFEAVIDKLERFEKVSIGISLDDVYDRAEFMRYPIDWDAFTQNMRYLNRSSIHNKYFNWTAYNTNISNLEKTIHWASMFNNISFQLADFVQFPSHMSIQNLPLGYKKHLINILKHVDNIDFYLTYMVEHDIWNDNKDVLYDYLNDISRVRGIDWGDVLPEIKGLYNDR